MYVCVCVNVCIHVHIHMHAYIRMCVVCVCVCLLVYVCVWLHIYTPQHHTQIHTFANKERERLNKDGRTEKRKKRGEREQCVQV